MADVKPDWKNILIVRTDRMGDVVLTTPVIAALREAYPHARLTMLVTPLCYDLVAGHPDLDAIWVDDRRKAHRGLWGYLRLVSQLRQAHFDVALVLHTKRRTNLACFLAGIPRRIGYKNNKFGFMLTDPLPDTRHQGQRHEVEYCLAVLRPWGIEGRHPQCRVILQPPAESWAEAFVSQRATSERLWVAIHPGASDPAKCWPATRFIELIQAVRQRYACAFVIVGDPTACAMAQEIVQGADLEGQDLWDLTGQTSVAQLASLLKRCDLLVSNDSGPVHVAAGVQTLVISLFTRDQPGINPERWRPWDQRSRVVRVHQDALKVLGLDAEKNPFAKAGALDKEYMELIPTEAVLEAVDALFKLC